MKDSPLPLMEYRAVPAAVPLAARLLRGWAVVNWLCTLLAGGVVIGTFCIPHLTLLSARDSFSGMDLQ